MGVSEILSVGVNNKIYAILVCVCVHHLVKLGAWKG